MVEHLLRCGYYNTAVKLARQSGIEVGGARRGLAGSGQRGRAWRGVPGLHARVLMSRVCKGLPHPHVNCGRVPWAAGRQRRGTVPSPCQVSARLSAPSLAFGAMWLGASVPGCPEGSVHRGGWGTVVGTAQSVAPLLWPVPAPWRTVPSKSSLPGVARPQPALPCARDTEGPPLRTLFLTDWRWLQPWAARTSTWPTCLAARGAACAWGQQGAQSSLVFRTRLLPGPHRSSCPASQLSWPRVAGAPCPRWVSGDGVVPPEVQRGTVGRPASEPSEVRVRLVGRCSWKGAPRGAPPKPRVQESIGGRPCGHGVGHSPG